MQPITFDRTGYRINGQPVYLYSGEFHYFRVPKADWRTRMRLFKEAGGNCLATYVPWLLHEPREGSFVFGETADHLDLEGFLQTALEEGLYVAARPGPYQYSELIYDGLPGWLCEKYPGLLARDYRGRIFRKSSVSYLHPLFMDKVQNWFAVIGPRLAKYTVSRGGPIAMLQFDNELAGIHEWFGTWDYHPVTMGFGQADGRYPRFLEQRYGQVELLNRAYGSRYSSFNQVLPPNPSGSQRRAQIRARKDYFDFYLGTIAEYAAALVELLRAQGIDTPFIHNSGNPNMNAHFLETAERLGQQFLLGSDHYYILDQTWPQNNPTPQYAARCFTSLEMLRLMGYPPSVFEMPGGSASDWPPVTEWDAQAAYLTHLGLGMKGHNFYIFTGGPNPPGAGNTTDLYDYGASIGADGEVRPLYRAQKALGDLLKQHPWLAEARRVADVRLALDFEAPRSEHYWRQGGRFLFTPPAAWDFWRKGPLTTAFCASYSPELVDLRAEDWINDTRTPLMVVSSCSMARSKQERLVRFLQNGGKALIFGVLPELDENLDECRLLLEFLGNPQQLASSTYVQRPAIAGVDNVRGSAFVFRRLPSGAQKLGEDANTGEVIAWQAQILGGGSTIVCGLTWMHAMREHEWMLVNLLTRLGAQHIISKNNPNLWASLLVSGDQAMLFIFNLLSSPQNAMVFVKQNDKIVHAGEYDLEPMSVETRKIELG